MNKLPEKNLHIDWQRLTDEFRDFALEPDTLEPDCQPFVDSLRHPRPSFVGTLLEIKRAEGFHPGEAVLALYMFLLEKRYREQLNLLYFAFDIFDDYCSLPQAIIDQTPFPHEDGTPPFRYHNDPHFVRRFL